MKKTLSVLMVSAAMTASPLLLAEGYRLELRGFLGEGEGLGNDLETAGGQITAYWNNVNDIRGVSVSDGAYAEAAFLSRASHLSFSQRETDSDGGEDSDLRVLDARIAFDNDIVFEVSSTEGPLESFGPDATRITLGIGSYWGENSLTTLRVASAETDVDLDSGIDSDPLTIQVATHGYRALEQGAISYDIDLGMISADVLEEGESVNQVRPTLGAGITYFLNDKFGVGASTNWSNLGDNDHFEYAAKISFYIEPRIGVALEYGGERKSDIGELSEEWTVSLIGRF